MSTDHSTPNPPTRLLADLEAQLTKIQTALEQAILDTTAQECLWSDKAKSGDMTIGGITIAQTSSQVFAAVLGELARSMTQAYVAAVPPRVPPAPPTRDARWSEPDAGSNAPAV